MPTPDKPRRHPNRDEKRALKAGQVAQHVKGVGRKAQKRAEPNDRTFDPDFDKKFRRVPPQELDRLLRDDEED